MVAANIADFCINIDDILEVSYNLGFILALITTNFKAAAIYYQQNKFQQLIDEVHRPISLLKYSSGQLMFVKKKNKLDFFQIYIIEG